MERYATLFGPNLYRLRILRNDMAGREDEIARNEIASSDAIANCAVRGPQCAEDKREPIQSRNRHISLW